METNIKKVIENKKLISEDQCTAGKFKIRKEVDIVLNYTIWETEEIDNLGILHAMGTLVKEDESTISDGDIKNISPSCSQFNISLAHSKDSRKTVPISKTLVQTDCQTS